MPGVHPQPGGPQGRVAEPGTIRGRADRVSGRLSRAEVAALIAELPPGEQAQAAELALELYGPGDPDPGERLGLHEYVRQAWPQVERRRFEDNWHIGVICEHLEAVTFGQIRNVIFNIPPRHTKSLCVSVMWPSWEWTFQPWIQWLFAAYAEKLSKRDSLRMRRLILSRWYRSRWGHVYSLTSDQREKLRYDNDRHGYRIATSVGGTGTGEGGDRVVVDDPLKAGQVHSDANRERANEWWDEEMSTRLNDPRTGSRVIIQQRLHENDTTGHVLAQGGYVHVRIPARYEPTPFVYHGVPAPEPDPVEWEDPRTKARQPLSPGRMGDKELAEIELRLGSYMTAAQLQQRPTPGEGGIIKRHWFRFWVPQHSGLPPVTLRLPNGEHVTCTTIPLPVRFESLRQSWDMTFRGHDDTDYVVGQVWAARQADRFLLDNVRRHAEFTEALDMVRALSRRWPAAVEKLVEGKANGPAIVSTLRSEIGGFVEVEPEGDKMARLRAVAPTIEGGNVYLPHPAIAPWVWDYIEELAAAPKGTHDDMADTTSQALRRMAVYGSTNPADWPTVRR